ncbi:MAG: hypothetical protein H0X51_09125 [Parachlamydiaceae bacterium]|nr:hypothetical protein [Parachlamydiaceae bacterium]
MLQSIYHCLVICLFLPLFLCSFTFQNPPFSYDLHPHVISGNPSEVLVTFHGMGGNYLIADSVKASSNTDNTIVSFNFPDYDFKTRRDFNNLNQITLGSIQELLPPLYLLKQILINDPNRTINLYGFSAGGGAVINLLAVLNSSEYDSELKTIGIEESDKKAILDAIEKGIIILDTPLKSVAELVATRPNLERILMAERYKQNGMEPIDNISKLPNRPFTFIVHFQEPDQILSNRDDQLYFEKLQKQNSKGKTYLIIGHDQGHMLPHPSLWKFYADHFSKE